MIVYHRHKVIATAFGKRKMTPSLTVGLLLMADAVAEASEAVKNSGGFEPIRATTPTEPNWSLVIFHLSSVI